MLPSDGGVDMVLMLEKTPRRPRMEKMSLWKMRQKEQRVRVTRSRPEVCDLDAFHGLQPRSDGLPTSPSSHGLQPTSTHPSVCLVFSMFLTLVYLTMGRNPAAVLDPIESQRDLP